MCIFRYTYLKKKPTALIILRVHKYYKKRINTYCIPSPSVFLEISLKLIYFISRRKSIRRNTIYTSLLCNRWGRDVTARICPNPKLYKINFASYLYFICAQTKGENVQDLKLLSCLIFKAENAKKGRNSKTVIRGSPDFMRYTIFYIG